MSSSSDVQKLYELVPGLLDEFGQLGKWTDEIKITDYPCLGGGDASAKQMFKDITQRLLRYGAKDLPRKILDGAKKLNELGYEDTVIIGYLSDAQFQIGMTCDYSDYIDETVSNILESRDKKDFEARYESMTQKRRESRKKKMNGV